MIAGKTKLALTSNILAAESIKQNITIISELKNLIPLPSDDEIKQLEANILEHGCQTPLQLWQVDKKEFYPDVDANNEVLYVLIDGHNRHQICKKHNLSFEVYILSFKNLKDAKDYIINLQLGRRNLSPSQISYFRGLKYNNEKVDKEDNLKVGPSKGQNDPSDKSTAERLGVAYNVSPKTIKRDAEFAEGLNLLSPELKKDILSGHLKAKKSDIQQLTKLKSPATPIDSLAKLSDLVSIKNQSETETITPDEKPSSKNEDSRENLINKVKESIKNANDSDLTLEIKGSFIINNGLVAVWKKLRGFSEEMIIDEDFTDRISIFQTMSLGIVQQL